MDRLKKIQIKNINDFLNKKIDLFLCSSSFDNRCFVLLESLSSNNIDRVAVCHFENNYRISETNLSKIGIHFGEKMEVLLLRKHNPISVYDLFYNLLMTLSSKSNVLIDTTTLTRENLLILIKVIVQNFSSLNVQLSYTPSSAYYKEDSKPEELWLSKGVRDIRTIIGYSGDFSSIKELLLIVLVGFEYERSETLIEAFEPTQLYIGQSLDSTSINSSLAKINNEHFQKIKLSNPQCKAFNFSCIDIETTRKELINIIEENREKYNIVISPMSNKLSTIATALVVLEYPDVQICYASTNQYNIEMYSSPCDYVYIMSLREYNKKP